MELKDSITSLRGVGPARAGQLKRLGVETVWDLLLTPPREYRDRRTITLVGNLVPGSEANVSGRIVDTGFVGFGKSRRFQALLSDGTGEIRLTFFNHRFISGKLSPGTRVTACGKVKYYGGFSMVHPELIFSGAGAGELVLPVYRLTAGISQAVLRNLVRNAIETACGAMEEVLPGDVLRAMGFESRGETVRTMHFPSSPEAGERARRVLALEEFYVHQSLLARIRKKFRLKRGISMKDGIPAVKEFRETLPFRLTGAQVRVIDEVIADVSGVNPMRRLLQGDVGSGKTVVAAAACLVCASAGYQAVIVAPTEVLAVQHHRNFKKLLEPMGIETGLLTGGTGRAARRELRNRLVSRRPMVLVGTHAVFEDDVEIPGLGLCVIDEQHKFGVEQRNRLLASRNPAPHLLLMSATPIPRTMVMSLYGDLDLSVLDEMPPGRGRTVTRIVGRNERSGVYGFMSDRVSGGERAFVVYPLRETSQDLDVRDAASACRVLKNGPLGRYGVGLLTGAMKPGEKLDVTGKFVSGEISVLVSTTVIEVGIDVPEATVMVVAHADRFGLSQLHQLRGRVGRGRGDSWCFLVKSEKTGPDGMKRLEIMASTSDGFEIAEQDLLLRGPGDVAGTRQHGLPEFRIADLARDGDLLARAAGLAAGEGAWKGLPREYMRRFSGFIEGGA